VVALARHGHRQKGCFVASTSELRRPPAVSCFFEADVARPSRVAARGDLVEAPRAPQGGRAQVAQLTRGRHGRRSGPRPGMPKACGEVQGRAPLRPEEAAQVQARR
jgi:hypothetical protein